jgi:ssDNA-binding Zn-finger/Zn-ribbon topoisomerase 1
MRMNNKIKEISTKKLIELRKCSLCSSEMILREIDEELERRKKT